MTQVFEKLLEVSLQTIVLTILILLARKIIIKRSNFFMNVLFTLLVVRLVIPISIQSPFSIQNLFNTSRDAVVRHAIVDNFTQTDKSNSPSQSYNVDNTSKVNDTDVSTTQGTSPTTPTNNKLHLSIMDIATTVWVFGVLLLSAIISINNMIFRRNLKKNRACNNPVLAKLINDCKESLSVNRNISAIYCNKVNTAAIHGVIKPILLISKESFNRLNMDEKRQILIHELLHIKRHDTLTATITVLLNIIHWFNPVLWIAFRTLRKDLEIMCDSEVLKNIGHQNKRSYATTLVKLVSLNPPKSSLLTTSLSVDTDIKRRITMISKQRKNTVLFTILSIIMVMVIAITGCTTKLVTTKEDTSIGIIDGADGPTAIYLAKTKDSTEEPNPDKAAALIDGEIISEPELTNKATTYDMELIGTFSLNYKNQYKNDEEAISNIKTASNILNNTILQPSEIISLNQILGDRSDTNQWKQSITISPDKSLGKGVLGICFTCTALYNSALIAELEIIDANHHSFPANYVPGGLDAMLNYGTDDLILKNPYDKDVKIVVSADNDLLKVDIYGVPRDYTVEVTSDLVENGEVPNYQYRYNCDTTPNGDSIPEGESVVVIKSQPKQTYNIIKTRYDLDGKEIDSSVINTYTYNERKGTIYVNDSST